jgi:hypothetical protein
VVSGTIPDRDQAKTIRHRTTGDLPRSRQRGVEKGVIARLNKKYVFVRFGKEEKSAVMTRDELEWKRSD